MRRTAAAVGRPSSWCVSTIDGHPFRCGITATAHGRPERKRGSAKRNGDCTNNRPTGTLSPEATPLNAP